MNVIMAGIDYQTAHIDLRERVSFTTSRVREIIRGIKEVYPVGVVLICTCNRTEIYISIENQEQKIDPVTLLCEYAEVDPNELKALFFVKTNKMAIQHLMEVSCGIHSMIFGEDQIISQIKEAIKISNEEKGSNSVLNALFRTAITCAKKVKTEVALRTVCPSVAKKAVELLGDYIQTKQQVNVLVIGNGQVGRNVCKELIDKGCEVYMTLRTYKYSETIVPCGCKTIDYDLRQSYMDQVDVIISATLSPHHTICFDMVNNSSKKPDYIIDLAVPRDIDPRVENIEGIHYYNIDTIGESALKDNQKEISQVNEIIREQMGKYEDWFIIHKHAADISQIKDLTIKKVVENMQKGLSEEQKIEEAISKTFDFIFYSLKDDISSTIFSNIKERISI